MPSCMSEDWMPRVIGATTKVIPSHSPYAHASQMMSYWIKVKVWDGET